MNDLQLRLAEDTDPATLVQLRDDAARWMLAQGITGQWRPGRLDEGHFRKAMASGEIWLAVVGHKAGKPQPGGAPKSFTLLEKDCGPAVA
ncbi:hypothetical protein ABZ840_06030 [Streptomyces sp. NPDC047117]|uniref:hypothetical protein n=1 Tax=Streptomyces sp. NPDC047117 TaxID=3155379 RepID=UPI003400BCB1